MKNKRYYLTTPLYYVNGEPHIGHAYTTILSDVLARYQRLFGKEVHFLTGLDEHGQKVADVAAANKISPQQHCDNMAIVWNSAWDKLNIKYDDLIRTTEKRHIKVVTDILSLLHNKGDIYLKEYEGWYSVFEEQYFTEKDLVDGNDPIGGRPVELRREQNYFFKLSKYKDWLVNHYQEKGLVIPESRQNEVKGFLRQELHDLCISRPRNRLSWGVPIPWDDDYVTWVWFDALINYYSATLSAPTGSTVLWPADYHIIGKDILTTHAVYWPAMLHAADIEPPRKIVAHGWWMGKTDDKISKSSSEVINPLELADKYGSDQLRYALMREMTVGQDSSYNEESILSRINTDLANDLGNLYSRLAKVWQSGGFAPAGILLDAPAGIPAELDEQKQVLRYHVQFEIERIMPHAAIQHVFNLVRGLNQLIEQVKPWKAVKDDPESIVKILTWIMGALGEIAEMLSPVMPTKMAYLIGWIYDENGKIDPTPGKQLFPRMKLVTKPEENSKQLLKTKTASDKSSGFITFDEFEKVELRAGKIISASKHPDADKLLVLQVDIGIDQRQIVSGIAKAYPPDELIGKCAIIVTNLKPIIIRGEKSNGMLLATGNGDDLKVAFLEKDVIPGSRVH